jgi:hypothetical protein
MPEITAINVFIEANGKQHIAIIDPTMADMFVAMLGAYQKGQQAETALITLPDSVTEHLLKTRQAIQNYIEQAREARRNNKRTAAQKGQP